MNSTPTSSKQKIHPHKFTMWLALGSICMMFAALTSAYIVKKNQGNFLEFAYPKLFTISTAVIVVSSLTMHLCFKNFKERNMPQYRLMLLLTLLLGIAFITLQIIGFKTLTINGIALVGANSNSAASFFLVIVGLHLLHVLAGILAILVRYIKVYFGNTKNYSVVSLEILATYWHFVDLLWIYLFIFLHLIK